MSDTEDGGFDGASFFSPQGPGSTSPTRKQNKETTVTVSGELLTNSKLAAAFYSGSEGPDLISAEENPPPISKFTKDEREKCKFQKCGLFRWILSFQEHVAASVVSIKYIIYWGNIQSRYGLYESFKCV